jgi:putative SOS response-associated peptidase YedK
MVDLHHRMPLVLGREHWQAWLDGDKPAGTLDGIERYAVGRIVNSPKNDDARCIAPIDG